MIKQSVTQDVIVLNLYVFQPPLVTSVSEYIFLGIFHLDETPWWHHLESFVPQLLIPEGLHEEHFITQFSRPRMQAVKVQGKTQSGENVLFMDEFSQISASRQNLKKTEIINSREDNALDRKVGSLMFSVSSLNTKIHGEDVSSF